MTPKRFSIYFHVPFCKSKCPYCSFASGIYPDETIERYFELSKKDFSTFFSHLDKPFEFTTLYIGGGTPSSVPREILASSIKILLSKMQNELSEITIEANPGDVDSEFINMIGEIGVTRVSLGAQSFNDDVLKFLGRRHDSIKTWESFNLLRKSGISNINLDLIHGIPGFGIDRWAEDLMETIELAPDHVSLYALTIEEGTPFYEQRIGDRIDHDSTASEYHLAVNALNDAGYKRYEISNFALPGKQCQHNINYWRLGDYVGFGLGSASYGNHTYMEKASDMDTYLNMLETGLPGIETIEKFEGRDRWVNALIMGMRLDEGIEIDSFNKRFGIDVVKEVRKVWKDYLNDQFVILDKNRLRFGENAVYISNSLLSMLI